jgi:hypothetical protein
VTTSTDITNRALQLLGTRTTIASLAETSNEAIQANLVYTALVNWCLVQANWNFARKSVVLAQTSTFTGSPWTTAQPTPQWIYQYNAPADYLRALYLFGTTLVNPGNTAFTGEPQRFAVSEAGNATVILSNQVSAGLIYTYTAGENQWSSAFERFVVHALAYTLCFALGEKDQLSGFYERMMHMFVSAEQINREEGLIIGDTSPEWIQAAGIPYPERRYDRRSMIQPRRQRDDNAG